MEFMNVSGEVQELPALDERVEPGGTFTATGDAAKGLLGNPAFDRTDKPSKTSDKE